MEGFKLNYIDCVWKKCKNFQRINTIEIYYYVSTDEYFVIEYNFNRIDFEIWKEIIEIHRDQNSDAILYKDNTIINEKEVSNNDNYYNFKLISKNFNLYRNINLIFYLEDEEGKNNMTEMIKINTVSS